MGRPKVERMTAPLNLPDESSIETPQTLYQAEEYEPGCPDAESSQNYPAGNGAVNDVAH